MSSTWVVGDIHGCADELAQLITKLQLGVDDRFISVGDLYHRGPDPVGVAEQLLALPQFELVLGNHERVILERMQHLPEDADLSGFDANDLAGDGGTSIASFDPQDSFKLLKLLKNRPYFIRGQSAHQSWIVVHAGIVPGRTAEMCNDFDLTRIRQVEIRGKGHFWADLWQGPELVIYGHTSAPKVRPQFKGEQMLSIGIDTGCVYGGALTAFRIEDQDLVQIPALGR